MKVLINNEYYNIEILRKNNKNTYIRVKDDLKIYVTCNYFVTENYILKLIKENIKSIEKMINREKRKLEKKNKFYLLGVSYDIVLCNIFKTPTIEENKVYTKDLESLNKFLIKEAKKLLPIRLEECYKKMNNNNIPYPKLIIRKMVRKWGHCNKRDKIVTLNSELIKYSLDEIDYVIVHELCHFIHFDHSKEFWKCVSFYKPNYKTNRKVLNEE